MASLDVINYLHIFKNILKIALKKFKKPLKKHKKTYLYWPVYYVIILW